ncbi:MAG: CHAT domain-containing protein [Egibacteraceae bacterium]
MLLDDVFTTGAGRAKRRLGADPGCALDRVRIRYSANARALNAARRMSAEATPYSILIVEQPLPVDARPLTHAEVEAAAAVKAGFAGSWSLREEAPIKHLRLEEATREAVKPALARYTVIHLCCHAFALSWAAAGRGDTPGQ